VLKTSIEKASQLLKNTYAQSIIDDNSPKTAASVLFVMASHFNSLKLTNSTPENSFSIKDWIINGEQDSMLFITSQENILSELSPLQTAWMEIAISGILSKNDDNKSKTWVIIDELPAMNKIPSLADALATTRSFGGCFVLGMQNIAQVREIYGRNGAQNISSECNTRCIFKSNDIDTAKWMSETIGEVEISEFKEGLSYGANTIRDGVTVNRQDKVKPLLLPSEITNMKALELILKMPDNPGIRSKLKYKNRKKVDEKYIENEQIIEDLKAAYSDVQEIDINTEYNISNKDASSKDKEQSNQSKKYKIKI
jgi:type IV secretory pathway TraG/TraD family ATPase VirD4